MSENLARTQASARSLARMLSHAASEWLAVAAWMCVSHTVACMNEVIRGASPSASQPLGYSGWSQLPGNLTRILSTLPLCRKIDDKALKFKLNSVVMAFLIII